VTLVDKEGGLVGLTHWFLGNATAEDIGCEVHLHGS